MSDPTNIVLPWYAKAFYLAIVVAVAAMVSLGIIKLAEIITARVSPHPSQDRVMMLGKNCQLCDRIREGIESDCGVPHEFHQ